jgi:hypothetical protein
VWDIFPHQTRQAAEAIKKAEKLSMTTHANQ